MQNSKTAKYLFIGGGNMAKAMIKGMQNNLSLYISVIERNIDMHHELINMQCKAFTNIQQCSINEFDCIILAVKPQDSIKILQELNLILSNKNTLIVSIMAGINTKFIKKYINNPCVRAMPNTPILIAKGITALFSENLNNEYKELIENIFKNSSKLHYLSNETDMHAVTALSGSGPAYTFYMLNYLTKVGEELGLKQELSKDLSAYTFLGASEMAIQSKLSLEQLQQNVMSKGGTTQAAINSFDNDKLFDALQNGVKKAYARSIELEKLFE